MKRKCNNSGAIRIEKKEEEEEEKEGRRRRRCTEYKNANK